MGFPGSPADKESASNVGDLGSFPGLGRSPGVREWLPTPVFWLGEFHGLCSSCGHKNLDTIEWLSFLLIHHNCHAVNVLMLIVKACCCYCCEVASVVSESVRPHGLQPTRLLRPWDSPGKNTGMGWHFLLQCIKVESESEVTQLCPTLSDPMDCSLAGSSIHGIFQARILEWGAISFSETSAY